jgi:hypothetical protein
MRRVSGQHFVGSYNLLDHVIDPSGKTDFIPPEDGWVRVKLVRDVGVPFLAKV